MWLRDHFSETPGAGVPGEAIAAHDILPSHLLDGDEIVILAIKPSLWFIVFMSFRWLAAAVVVITLSDRIGQAISVFDSRTLIQGALVLAAARLAFAMLQWVSRLYVLTNRRVLRLRGILNIDIFECQLGKIQNTYLTVAWYERMTGLGTISFATAGTGGVEASWTNVNDPLEVHERIRSAIRRARGSGNGL